MVRRSVSEVSAEEEVLAVLNTGTLEQRIEKTIRFAARAMAMAALASGVREEEVIRSGIVDVARRVASDAEEAKGD